MGAISPPKPQKARKAALMDSPTSPDPFQPEEMDVLSLYRVLEQVTDHRHKRGVRYPLALVLSLVVLGKLAGMTSLAGIAEWVRWRADQVKLLLPGTRASWPCASTYGKVLRRVEAEEVTRLMAQWLRRLSATGRCGSEASRLRTQGEACEQHTQVALDGWVLNVKDNDEHRQ